MQALLLKAITGAVVIRRAVPTDTPAMSSIVREAFRGPWSLGDGPLVWAEQASVEADLRTKIAARLRKQAKLEAVGQTQMDEVLLVACDGDEGEMLGCADLRVEWFDVESRKRAKPPSPRDMFLSPEEEGDRVQRPYLCNLAVSPVARRRGIGAALVRACEEQSVSWGYEELFLEVVESNEGALAFYRALDYSLEPCDEQAFVTKRQSFWFASEWEGKLRLSKRDLAPMAP